MASQQLISGRVSLKEKHRLRRDLWQEAYMQFEPSTKILRLYSLNAKTGETEAECRYSTAVLGVSVPQPKLGIAKRPNRFDVMVPESEGSVLCFSTSSQTMREELIEAIQLTEYADHESSGESGSDNESDGDADHDRYEDRDGDESRSFHGSNSPDHSHSKPSSNADTETTDNTDLQRAHEAEELHSALATAAVTVAKVSPPSAKQGSKPRSATPKKPRPPPPPHDKHMPTVSTGSNRHGHGHEAETAHRYAPVHGDEHRESKADASNGYQHRPGLSPLKAMASEEARRQLATSTAQLAVLAQEGAGGNSAFFDSAFDTAADGNHELVGIEGRGETNDTTESGTRHDSVLPLLYQEGGGVQQQARGGSAAGTAGGHQLTSIQKRLSDKGSIKEMLVAAAAEEKAALSAQAKSGADDNKASGMSASHSKEGAEDEGQSKASKAWGLAYTSLTIGKAGRIKKGQGRKQKKKKKAEPKVKLSQNNKKMRKNALELIKAIETKPKPAALAAVRRAVEEDGLKVDVDIHEAEKDLPFARRTPETKRTPLIAAVRSGNVDVVKYLLEHGAGRQGFGGLDCYSSWSPLHYAAEAYNTAMFEMLYEAYKASSLANNDPDTGETITPKLWLQRHRTCVASDAADNDASPGSVGNSASSPQLLGGSRSFGSVGWGSSDSQSMRSTSGLAEMGGGGEDMTVLDVALSSRRWRMVSTAEQAAAFVRHLLREHELPVNPERCMVLVARGGCLQVLRVMIEELELEPWTCEPSQWLAPIFEFGFVPMLDFLLTNAKLKHPGGEVQGNGNGSGGGGFKQKRLEALFGDRVFAMAIANAQTDPLEYFIGNDLVKVTPRYRKWGRTKGPFAGDFADMYHNRVFEWLVTGRHGQLFKSMLLEESMDGVVRSLFDSCRTQAFLMQTNQTIRVYWSKRKLRVLCGYSVEENEYVKLVPVHKQAVAIFIHALDKRPELKPLIQHSFFTFAIEMKMRAFGRRVMAFELIMYALLLMFFSLGFVAYPGREYIGFRVTCWLLSLYQWLKEILELRSGGFLAYVSDPWNYLNMSLLLGLLLLVCLENENPSDPRHASLSALVSLSIWTGVLQFVNLNESAAAFVITIQRMMVDMCKFLIMFLIFWMGFSYAFYLLLGVNGPLGDDYVEEFSSVRVSLATTFLIMLGDWDYSAFSDNSLVQVGFFVYVLLSVVLLLNMLIAMMSSSFEEVRENASVEARVAMWESVIRLETYVDMCGNGLWGQCYARMEEWLCEKADTVKVSKVEREYLKEDVLKETRLTRQEPVPPTPPRDYAAECYDLMETLKAEFEALGKRHETHFESHTQTKNEHGRALAALSAAVMGLTDAKNEAEKKEAREVEKLLKRGAFLRGGANHRQRAEEIARKAQGDGGHGVGRHSDSPPGRVVVKRSSPRSEEFAL